MNFFIADLHFGHANIIKYCRRPFADVREMDRKLMRRWNLAVSPDDDIYILGDFTLLKPSLAEGLLLSLNGHKHLITGNHDYFARTKYLKRIGPYFREIVPYKELRGELGCTFILMHYPLLFWNGSLDPQVIHLYGHIHNNEFCNSLTSRLERSLNVGADMPYMNFTPLSEAQVMTLISSQKIPAPLNLCPSNDGPLRR